MNTVLITGATGAIGSALAPLYLAEPDTRLLLLMRADSDEHLAARLKKLYAFWQIDAEDRTLAGRVQPLRGDISKPSLGLSESDYELVVSQATHVVHCAGAVKLNQTLDQARAAAVDSIRHVVDLCERAATRGRFKKLDYTSTVGVGGRMTDPVPEAPLPGPVEYHNTYEAAKAEAERFLIPKMQAGLPATIHRPSMVVGDTHTGKIIHFQVFYYLSEFFAGLRTWGFTPKAPGRTLDIIPVDYVARAIHLASQREDSIGRVLHECSGPDHAPLISDLAPRLRALLTNDPQAGKRLRAMPYRWMRRLIPVVSPFVSKDRRRTLSTLPHFLTYFDEQQIFANTDSTAYLSAHGIDVPGVDAYLDNVLRYYLASRSAG